MIVCIAEKPSVAKEIADVLGAHTKHDGYIEGNGYQVTWTFYPTIPHLIPLLMTISYMKLTILSPSNTGSSKPYIATPRLPAPRASYPVRQKARK